MKTLQRQSRPRASFAAALPGLALSGLALFGVALFGVALSSCAEREATFTEAQVLGGERVEAATLERGLGHYRRHCATCHGPSGQGDGPRGAGLEPPPADLSAGRFPHASGGSGELPSRSALVRVMREGIEGTAMGPQHLRDEDLRAVAAYVMTLSPVWSAASSENSSSDSP